MRRLVETLSNTGDVRNGRFRLVTVTAVSGQTVSLELTGPGGSAGTLTGVRYLASYSPTAGDVALLWSDGAFSVVVGALA